MAKNQEGFILWAICCAFLMTLGAACSSVSSKADSHGAANDSGSESVSQDARSNTNTDADTATNEPDAGPQDVCPVPEDPVCEDVFQEPPIPLAFSLSQTGIAEAKINSVAAHYEGNFSWQYYLIAAVGTGRLEADIRPFLIVFRSTDASSYTVNWLSEPIGDTILGLDYDFGHSQWRALVCGESCSVVSSTATDDAPAPLMPVTTIKTLDNFVPVAAAESDSGALFTLVGDGIVRLESDGTWSTLVAPGTGPVLRAAYEINYEAIVAVGDSGRIVSWENGTVTEINSGTTAPFSSVWATHLYKSNPDDVRVIIKAFSATGESYFTNSQGVGKYCPFTQGVIGVSWGGPGVWAATAQGNLFLTKKYLHEWLQCPCGSFGGSLTGLAMFLCGIGDNPLGWNEQEVFANPEPFCAVD